MDDAVVHVGEIHYLQDAIAGRAQEAAQNVLKHEGTKISDVREIVDRRAASVDANFALVNRLERFQAICKRVVEADVGGFGGGHESNILADGSYAKQSGWLGGFLAGWVARKARDEIGRSSGLPGRLRPTVEARHAVP